MKAGFVGSLPKIATNFLPFRLRPLAGPPKLPKNFLVAAKVPQEIRHEKCLDDCDKEFSEE